MWFIKITVVALITLNIFKVVTYKYNKCPTLKVINWSKYYSFVSQKHYMISITKFNYRRCF